MCDLIYDVISCSVWTCDTGKVNAYDKIMIENIIGENMAVKESFTYISMIV